MESLTSKLEKVIFKLEKFKENDPGQPNFTPFRDFERFCNQLVFETSDNYERFSAFFFAKYFSNFFDNLGGDAKFDEQLRMVKIRIYNHLENSLREVRENLSKKDNENVTALLCDIINVYTTEINYLNKQF
jgi:hypothetical protein